MASSWLERIGYLFYIVNPWKTAFEKIEEVPNYVVEVGPYFAVLILLEGFVLYFKKKQTLRINDGITSIFQGMQSELARVLLRGLEFAAYIYIYNNWRIIALPWKSPWTWFICFFGVDLAYYWLHRASHEVNILWASHQVHHSSEEYNLSTALRQSIFQNYSVWIFYLPLALFMPPSVFMVHTQFNLLYQFWIHTELIDNLGPLEYILNTPSHHRVHHGRNRYCIDKNYGGTLIIFDRLFGTFEAENEKVVYGLTHPLNTFLSPTIQFAHFKHIFKTFWEVEGIRNKLSVLFKGPGWEPGKPRLGLIEDIPDVQYPVQKYDSKLPGWLNFYVVLHSVLIILGHFEVTERHATMSQWIVLGAIAYQLLSLNSIGALLDGRPYAPLMELVRCLLFLAVDYYYLPVTRLGQIQSMTSWVMTNLMRVCFSLCAVLWTFYGVRMISIRFHSKKVS